MPHLHREPDDPEAHPAARGGRRAGGREDLASEAGAPEPVAPEPDASESPARAHGIRKPRARHRSRESDATAELEVPDEPVNPGTTLDGETLTADGEALTADGEEITLSILGERTFEPKSSKRARMARLREVIAIVRRYDVVHGLTPVQFRALLEELGPTFVKAGQILSMRTEIIPPAFCKVLESLRENAEPMPFATVLEVLEAQYARPLSTIFAQIDEEPLGSASVAQVHRATLVSGEVVAIKVQRPHVRETMAQDIEVLRSLIDHLTPFFKSLQVMDLQGVIDELWESFTEETDFLVEARNLTEFREANAQVAYVTAPRPYLSHSTSQVLVMEYVDGLPISDPAAIRAAGYDIDDIGVKLVTNYVRQVLDEGFFHADPHPGNIMIRDRKIVWLDLGMVGSISGFYRQIIRKILMAVGSRDSAKLKDGLLALSETREVGDIDHGRLLADLDEIVATYGSIDLAELDLGKFLNDLVALARRYKIELPGAMTMIARGFVTLEGVLDEFIPGISIIAIIERHLFGQESLASAASRELEELGIEGRKALHGTLEGLADLGLVTQMLTRGQLKVNMDFSGSADPVEDLSHIADRLTMGVIVAGLLLGSAMLFSAGVTSGWIGMAIVAIVGYGIAVLMALFIAWDIWKRHRSRRQR